MVSYSSYMEQGALVQDLQSITARRMKRGFYIALRLNQGLTPEQNARAVELAEEMIRQNAAWRHNANNRRQAFVNALPLSQSLKDKLFKRIRATGYDWPGLFIGKRQDNRWTCIGFCLELIKRQGIKCRNYGTGLLGLGTGILNPIMPVRFLFDPAFELYTLDDKADFERASQ